MYSSSECEKLICNVQRRCMAQRCPISTLLWLWGYDTEKLGVSGIDDEANCGRKEAECVVQCVIISPLIKISSGYRNKREKAM